MQFGSRPRSSSTRL
uniref:Uncharacterized protein n=1 Tax=Timema tahoe TaxID=61484 RepID=A0A7R9ISX5_9NEOP|nr:unnamed protein product [Timema tahoe]